MKKTLFVLVGLFITATTLCAQQTFSVEGSVFSPDNLPIPGASITILEGKTVKGKTPSNSEGTFVFNAVKTGHYRIEISALGLQKTTLDIKVEHQNLVLQPTILQSNEIAIDEVAVYGKYYQNYKLDSLSGSLRLKTSILELPQNIQVISSDIMADQQVFDIVDGITRNISGATRQGHWDNQYANIRMRGSKIPAFRNGMNIEASWGPTAEDASMIERIEFVKGPAGFMLASGEPGGFYNVVTKKPSGRQKGSATFSMGSFSTYRGALDFDGKLSQNGKLLYRLNVAAQQKDYFTKYNYNNRVVVAPVLTYKVDTATSITIEYTYQGSKYLTNGNYTFSPKQFADPDIDNDFFYGDPSFEPGKLRDHSAYLYLDHSLNSKWKLHAQLAYFNFNMTANSTWLTYMKENGDMPRNWSIADETGENRFAQFSFNGEERTGGIRHRILVGGDFGNKKFWGDFREILKSLPIELNVYNPQYGISGSAFPVIDRSQSTKVRAGGSNYVSSVSYMSFYAHDELAFLEDQLRLSLGLRFTNAETVGRTGAADIKDNVLSPRVGLSYSIDRATSVYSLFDQSFVPVSGTDWEGNAFKPIRGNNIELGLKREWFGGRWISTLSAYTIKRQNQLVTDYDHPMPGGSAQFFQKQEGEAKTQGIEMDISGEVVRGLNVNVNYALTDSKITKSTDESVIGNITPNTAKHTANAWLSYRIQKGVLKGFGLMGSVQTMFDRAIGTTKEANFKNYVRTDGGLSYQKKRYMISFLINNLLDNRSLLTAGSFNKANAEAQAQGGVDYYSYIVEARRNMRLGIMYKF
ncbi:MULTISPECIES: TonB-dependent receptor [Olivibacter]|jgi:iron complex outermembrane receptor protein|uniref:TonB-dependent siderophore receptor n=2 Tax=Sphingobacteriaceae TaxID=84566 RepID=F4CC48_SPHS2|nr:MULTISPECIES: TonB-dependent receptor [unclassified Olivibacter]MDM8177864.1 TonB-dependent receptor [Olivibacter sp. 47]QEK99554.1 TonB-dependent siderophore receptor [Olivibacter sp. LS-1]